MLRRACYTISVVDGEIRTDTAPKHEHETVLRATSIACQRARPEAAVLCTRDLYADDASLVPLVLVVGVQQSFDAPLAFDGGVGRWSICLAGPCNGVYRTPGRAGEYSAVPAPWHATAPRPPPLLHVEHADDLSLCLRASGDIRNEQLCVDESYVGDILPGTHTYTLPQPHHAFRMLATGSRGIWLQMCDRPPVILLDASRIDVPLGGRKTMRNTLQTKKK